MTNLDVTLSHAIHILTILFQQRTNERTKKRTVALIQKDEIILYFHMMAT